MQNPANPEINADGVAENGVAAWPTALTSQTAQAELWDRWSKTWMEGA